MKLVKLQYIRDHYKYDSLIGAVAVIYDGGKLGIGISVKSPSDTFSKSFGRNLAFSRAKESLKRGVDLSVLFDPVSRQSYDLLTGNSIRFSSSYLYEIEDTLSTVLADVKESLFHMFVEKDLLENT